MKLYSYISGVIAFVLIFSVSLAQNSNPLEGKDSLVLENERINDVIDSNKPFIKPPYQEIKKADQEEVTYESQEFYVETTFEPIPPRVKPLDEEKKEIPKNNLIRLGIGRFTTPIGQLYINNGPDQNIDYGLQFTHISAHNDQITLRRFREDYGTLKATSYQGGYNIYGKVSAFNTTYFNYAGDDTTLFPGESQIREDSLRMGFTRFSANAGIASAFDSDESYFYDANLGLKIYGGQRNNSEFHVGLTPTVGTRFNEQSELVLDGEVTYVRGRIDTSSQNRFFTELNPAFNLQAERLRLKVGLNYTYFTNSADSGGVSNLGPDIEVAYGINPTNLTAFAGVTSGMQHNHYYNMIFENRYLQNDVEISPTVERYQIYAGVKGNVAQIVDFGAKVYYRRMQNQLMYRTQDSIYFDALYDSLTTITGAHIEANYDLDENISAGAALNVNVYNTSNQDSLTPFFFHAAPFRLDVYGEYIWDNKLTARADVSFYGPTPMSVDATGEAINRPLFADLSVLLDYRPVPGFSIFVGGNNLLGSNYQRWFNYPERRFDIRGGVTVAF